jgi:hypothetical protein
MAGEMTEPTRPPPIIPGEDVARRYALEERRMNLQAGWTVPTYIAGGIAVLLTLACILSLFLPTNVPSAELWKLVLPVITAILGYLFGKST